MVHLTEAFSLDLNNICKKVLEFKFQFKIERKVMDKLPQAGPSSWTAREQVTR